jgi:hypothetical protein
MVQVKVREAAVHNKAPRTDPSDQNDPNESREVPKPVDDADTKEEELTEVDAEALLHHRTSVRKRAVQAALILLCLLMMVGVFHNVTMQPSRLSASTPTPSTSDSLVAIQSNLSFGSVSIDGKKLPGKPPFFFQLTSRGATIVYSAPPFAPQTCQVSWTGDGTQIPINVRGPTCSLNYDIVSATVHGQVIAAFSGVVFESGMGDLPAIFQASALDFVRKVVTPVSLSTTVPVGQYYATGRGTRGMILSRQATKPLDAQVSLLVPSPQELSSSALCPQLLCAGFDLPLGPATPAASKDQLWASLMPWAMTWKFLQPDGQLVGMERNSQISSITILILALDSQHHWHLGQYASPADLLDAQRQNIHSTICDTGVSELESALQSQQDFNQTVAVVTDKGLAGCIFKITRIDETGTDTVVWRFGVLLAADRATHSDYPWLPLAPQAEVDAVSGS